MEHAGRDDDDEELRGPDRLSELPDHILLCVLERLRDDAQSLARTCVLSKRWRTLPLMLSELDISAKTFLPADRRTTRKLERVLHATGRFADAVRFFLLATGDDDHLGYQRAIKTLRLELYLTEEVDYLLDTLRLVDGAIGRGEVKDLELLVRTERGKAFLREQPTRLAIPLLYGGRFKSLLRGAPPAMLGSLKSLTLRNLCFLESSSEVVVETLLRTCPALEVLALDSCGFNSCGDFSSTLTIDAPWSRLKELSSDECFIERFHVVQAPKLAHFTCKEWFCVSCPVTFGPASVPSLEEIVLCNSAAPSWPLSFALSELLENTHGVATVTLAFGNGKIWVRPEGPENLDAAFSNLKKLHLMEIFRESDLSWTVFLLQAARRLELVDIEVCNVCWSADADDNDDNRDVVRDTEWEVPEGFRHHHLRRVRVGGDIDDGKHVRFMSFVIERAVSLELLVLDARIEYCQGCVDAQRLDPFIVLSNFPDDKEGVDELVRRQVKGGIATSARVLVYTASNQVFQY